MDSSPVHDPAPGATTYLIGAGVVGRAILAAHVGAGVSVCMADQQEAAVRDAVSELRLDRKQWHVSEFLRLGELAAITISRRDAPKAETRPPVVIESITERVEVKEAFFTDAERLLGADAILCTNTSTLRVSRLAQCLSHPERFCAMHFFMPVIGRRAVELVPGDATSVETIERSVDHITRLGKEPLIVGDGPGFLVNRMLSPYLNEAMAMLCRGVAAEQIERAAIGFGMPVSPLELIDLIGAQTAFLAGRVYWQSFPARVDPSPLLPALVKHKRFGRASGAGLYDYCEDIRSDDLAPRSVELCDRYRRHEISLRDNEVMLILSIPMWIEAALAHRDGIVGHVDQIDIAMRDGLGFESARSFLEFFDSVGSQAMLDAIVQWGDDVKSMRAPEALQLALRSATPRQALVQFTQST